jgi:protein-S-isoprenylcysteine O-methyltransferase Ste14
MAAPPNQKTRWQKIARRIRVPLGFVVAAVFLVFAHPTPFTLTASLVLILPGLWLRAYAAGYVKKNAELTCTGPYAYTRNPLYLGSMGIAFGFAIAAGRWPLALLLVALFLAIYIPTILSEEAFLRSNFGAFELYAANVPRLLPRLRAAHFANEGGFASIRGRFSRERYLHHREYNACIGAAAIYIALVIRMAWPTLHATLIH